MYELRSKAVDEYLGCARTIIDRLERVDNTDYQAAAHLLLSDCAIRGYSVDVDVGSVKGSGALATSCSVALVITAAVLYGVTM